jgi:alpha-beta hydrolase superfamily lysophospholipase
LTLFALLSLSAACGAFQPPPRAVAAAPTLEASIERAALQLSSGERIPADLRILDGDGPIVVALHGLGGYARDFEHLIDDFTAHGLSVVAIDLRGLGRWPEPRGNLRNIGVWLADLDGVFAALRREHPGRPVVLLGESMGAAVATWYQRERADGGKPGADALVAYSVVIDPQVKLGFFRTLGIGLAFTFAPSSYIDIAAEPETISTDAEFQKRYTTDPAMTLSASLRFLGQVQKMVRQTPERLSEVTVPLLIVQPGDDIFSSAKGRARLREQVPQAVYQVMADCKHAMINDGCRDEVFALTRGWLHETVIAR